MTGTFLPPFQDQLVGAVLDDVAQGVNGGVLRVGADLQGEITMADMPIQRVVGKSRHPDQPPRFERCEPRPVLEQRGSERDRDGQCVGPDDRPDDARIRRGQPGICLHDPAAGGQEGDALRQPPEQTLQRVGRFGDDVEARDHSVGRP
jgi:hypothetical protein